MRKYLTHIELGFRRYQQYPTEFMFMALKRLLQIIFIVVLWDIISKGTSNDSLVELISYFVVFNAVMDLIMVQSFTIGNRLSTLIYTGGLNNILIKPVKPTLYVYFKEVGVVIPLMLVSVISVIVFVALGYIDPGNMLVFGVYMLIAIIIGISLNVILSTYAFYYTRIFGIREVFKFFMRIFSGSFIPIYFMPETIQSVLDASLVSYVGYKPVMILLGRTTASLNDLMIGILWAILCVFISKLLWSRAITRYEAYGI